MLRGTLFLVTLAICNLFSLSVLGLSSRKTANVMTISSNVDNTNRIRVAHLGNSIQYFNDCPRLLEQMLRIKYSSVYQDSCFRGGANLLSLWEKGNGMKEQFSTPAAETHDGTFDVGSATVKELLQKEDWDFVIINDHTQAPVRETSKQKSLQALQEIYLPIINTSSTTVIFIMTAAYKSPVKASEDLGSFDDFTKALQKGYDKYSQIFVPNVKIAPLGTAYQYVRNKYDKATWEKLYAPDDFHPSPHGTYLEAAILYCTIVGERPPDYDEAWWKTSRYMKPVMPLPTPEEAELLRTVACHVCQLPQSSL